MLDKVRFDQMLARFALGSRLLRAERLLGGISAETHRLHYLDASGQPQQLVCRRYHRHHAANRGDEAAQEFGLLQALHQRGLNVPQPLYFDASGTIFPEPYMLMAYIDGRYDVAPKNLDDYIAQFARQLAVIHQGGVISAETIPIRHAQPSNGELQRGTHSSAIGNLAPIYRYLRSQPAPQRHNPSTLLHGDFWPGNTLWRDGKLIAVIDWEDAMLGDPLLDLAISRLDMALLFGVPACDAFTSAYLNHNPIDIGNLPHWDLCASLRIARTIGDDLIDWVSSNPQNTDLEAAAQFQQQSFKQFVSQAFNT